MESRHSDDEPIAFIEIVRADDPFSDFAAEPLDAEPRTSRTLRTPRTFRAFRLLAVAALSSMATAAVLLVFRSQPSAPERQASRVASSTIRSLPDSIALPEASAPPSDGHAVSPMPEPPALPNELTASLPVDLDLAIPAVPSAGESRRALAAPAPGGRPTSSAVDNLDVTVPFTDVLPGAASAPDLVAALGSAPPPVASTTAAGVATPTAAIESVLDRYASSFSALDARAAKAVWPGVNERSLARAFDGLEQQELDLGECDISVTSARATASCDGVARYVPKVGSRRVRAERRQWTFHLQSDGRGWSIENVDMRQP